MIAANSLLIPVLLEEFHSSPTGGHSGFYRTYRRLAANIYWIGMVKKVQEYVQNCDVCQRYKVSTTAPASLIQPLQLPEIVWNEISMDFITGLAKSKGFEVIWVVVDRLSKYAHFILLKRPFSARVLAEVFVKEIVRLHGVPQAIVSDRDPVFTSAFWKKLFQM